MRLLLIRHGQTPANVRGELDTRAPGPGLTGLGEQQAEALPAALGEVDTLFVSPLRRTHLTAAPLAAARGLTPVELSGLREVEAGDLEGRSDDDAVARYHAVFAAWVAGDPSRPMPGGPGGAAFFERYDRCVERIAAATGAGGTAAVVSHGAAIRTWAGSRAANLDEPFVSARPLENTGVVTLEGAPGHGWTCLDWAGEPLGGEHLADRTAPDPTGAGF